MNSSPRIPRLIPGSLAGLALFAAAACTSTDTTTAPPAAAPTSSAPVETPSQAPSSAAPSASTAPSSSAPSGTAAAVSTKTLLAAAATAREAVDGGRVSSVELEDNGTWEIHLVFNNGGEQYVRVAADGGSVTSGPTDDRPDTEDRRENAVLYDVDVDYREAVKIAEREVDGGQVRELSLDADDNRNEWEIDIRDGNQPVTLTVNADNGNVIDRENDD